MVVVPKEKKVLKQKQGTWNFSSTMLSCVYGNGLTYSLSIDLNAVGTCTLRCCYCYS